MALTKEFKQTVTVRAERDPAFREPLLKQAVELLRAGDLKTGKAVLRDHINVATGFAKSLMRMLGPHGNPRPDKLLTMIAQRVPGLHLAAATER